MKNVIYFDFANGVQITEQEHAEDMEVEAFNKKVEKFNNIIEKVSIGMCSVAILVAISIMMAVVVM